MARYEIINSKTGETMEVTENMSGGDAKRYAEMSGRNFYAKRVWEVVQNDVSETPEAVEVVEAIAPVAPTAIEAPVAPAVAPEDQTIKMVAVVESSKVNWGAGCSAVVCYDACGNVLKVLMVLSSHADAVAYGKFQAVYRKADFFDERATEHPFVRGGSAPLGTNYATH